MNFYNSSFTFSLPVFLCMAGNAQCFGAFASSSSWLHACLASELCSVHLKLSAVMVQEEWLTKVVKTPFCMESL